MTYFCVILVRICSPLVVKFLASAIAEIRGGSRNSKVGRVTKSPTHMTYFCIV